MKCKKDYKKVNNKCVRKGSVISPTYKNYSGEGIGFFGLLTILFIALKLTRVISWSWWLILLPLYAPIVLGIIIFIIFLIIVKIAER